MTSLVQELRDRHLVQDLSDEQGIDALPAGTPFYVGFDPTAPYLHIGNLVPIIVSLRLAKRGLKPIILFGGSTGAIGDPSGKSKERTLLSREEIDTNIERQSKKVKEIFERQDVEVSFVNNYEWTKDMSVLEFLRDVGKHFTVNFLIQKEVIRSRLDGDGISFTEFSYMLLQAFDYLHLYNTRGCRLQIGGSDQWGNITAGLELIRRKHSTEHGSYALSCPLILDSEGKKFGKSAGGALWIDEQGLSPYKLHQYLLNTKDADVERYLQIFSDMSADEIKALITEHNEAPHKRVAQQALADTLTAMIHGEQAVEAAKLSASVLFGGSLERLSARDLEDIFGDVPSTNLDKSEVVGSPVVDLLVQATSAKSKGEARRLIKGGGVYINNVRVESEQELVAPDAPIDGKLLVIRLGKKNYSLVKF